METSPVNRKAIALLILVFALGIALGVVGTRVVNARAFAARSGALPQGNNPPRAVARLTQELNLTPDQQKQITEILSEMQAGYNNVREQANPQYDRIRSQGRDHIRQVLTPEQQPKFEVYLQRLDQERRERDKQNR